MSRRYLELWRMGLKFQRSLFPYSRSESPTLPHSFFHVISFPTYWMTTKTTDKLKINPTIGQAQSIISNFWNGTSRSVVDSKHSQPLKEREKSIRKPLRKANINYTLSGQTEKWPFILPPSSIDRVPSHSATSRAFYVCDERDCVLLRLLLFDAFDLLLLATYSFIQVSLVDSPSLLIVVVFAVVIVIVINCVFSTSCCTFSSRSFMLASSNNNNNDNCTEEIVYVSTHWACIEWFRIRHKTYTFSNFNDLSFGHFQQKCITSMHTVRCQNVLPVHRVERQT